MMAHKRSFVNVDVRRAAELRKQASVQRHIELVRLMRRDGSGALRKSTPVDRRKAESPIPKILSELGEEGDVAAALREWLRKNASKVMGLFYQWDDDHNGTVDKGEFRKAMRALGLQAPAAHVDAIFDEFDLDGGRLLGMAHRSERTAWHRYNYTRARAL